MSEDSSSKPRTRARRMLLTGVALTTSSLLAWCDRSGPAGGHVVYSNPKGPVYEQPQGIDAGTSAVPQTSDDAGTSAAPQTSDAGSMLPQPPQPPTQQPQRPPPPQPRRDAGPATLPLPGNPKGSMYDRDAQVPAPLARDAGVKDAGQPAVPQYPRIYANPKYSLYDGALAAPEGAVDVASKGKPDPSDVG